MRQRRKTEKQTNKERKKERKKQTNKQTNKQTVVSGTQTIPPIKQTERSLGPVAWVFLIIF